MQRLKTWEQTKRVGDETTVIDKRGKILIFASGAYFHSCGMPIFTVTENGHPDACILTCRKYSRGDSLDNGRFKVSASLRTASHACTLAENAVSHELMETTMHTC